MMRRALALICLICLPALLLTPASLAGSLGDAASNGAHSLDPMVLGGIAILLMIAKLGGEFFERFKQPAVLGELIGGIVIGNLAIIGFTGFEPLKASEVIGALAEIGVIILLFEVGLESNVREMLEVGWSSLLVAIAGVIAPFFLGWGVAAYFLPGGATLSHIFIGATLCATSVGITARVLCEKASNPSRNSKTAAISSGIRRF